MAIIHFITHPEVTIDPAVPVPDWSLSPLGVQRMRRALEQPWLNGVGAVFSSAERKAREAADMVAGHFGLAPIVIAGLGENDRSATGYLPKIEFEATADTFFAQPTVSVRGWEPAADAQRRIIAAVERCIAMASTAGDIAIVSHGGVGALLLCHLKQVPISRSEDQPGEGGGNDFSFDAASRRVLRGWRPIHAGAARTMAGRPRLIHEYCAALPPVTAKAGRVLVLGSMPGRASLQAGQYYFHPQNRFWRIMGQLAGAGPGLSYDARIAALTSAGISLWDVLQSCDRQGSLDSAITNEVANDFAGFLGENPSISHIYFNGAKAEHAFRRRVLPTLTGSNLSLQGLPSTSPANARMSFAQLLEAWRIVVTASIACPA